MKSEHLLHTVTKGEFKRKLRIFYKKVNEMFKSEHEHFTYLIQKTYIQRDLMVIILFIFYLLLSIYNVDIYIYFANLNSPDYVR